MTLREFFALTAKEILDLRFQLVWLSVLLLFLDKLTSTEWITFVVSICGVRVINDFGTMVKDTKMSNKEKPVSNGN